MYYTASFATIKTILFILGMGLFHTISAQNVSLRAGIDISLMGEIDGAFVGPSVGLEVTSGKAIGLGLEFSIAGANDRTLWKFQPSVKYYFGRQVASGFFFGVQAKIMGLRIRESQELPTINIYAVGPMIGVKQSISENLEFSMVTTPHLVMEGTYTTQVLGIGFNASIAYKF